MYTFFVIGSPGKELDVAGIDNGLSVVSIVEVPGGLGSESWEPYGRTYEQFNKWFDRPARSLAS